MLTRILIFCAVFVLAGCAQKRANADADRDPAAAKDVQARLIDEQGQLTGVMTMKKVTKSEKEWRDQLTPEQFHVVREKGTERAFTGAYHDSHDAGMYNCVACGLPLFSSDTKFESGTGWPSFFAPVAKENVAADSDDALGMRRTEILCARCEAHLGHVFDDGPNPTGLRYCVNSASLNFVEQGAAPGKGSMPAQIASVASTAGGLEKATFGAGCFWGVEAAFRQVKGVANTAVGYLGGTMENPTYKDVCSGRTGHAEVVEVEYDPAVVTYDVLLDIFWENHDPTTLNRQGPDVGDQYRSAIFYHTPAQRDAAAASKEKRDKGGFFSRPIVTEITQASAFYRAEDYHQQYLEKRGLSSCHVDLK